MRDTQDKITVEIDAVTSAALHRALIKSTTHVGDFVPVPIEWLIGKLKMIANCGQSVEPDHWKFRCMAREAAQEIIDKLEAH